MKILGLAAGKWTFLQTGSHSEEAHDYWKLEVDATQTIGKRWSKDFYVYIHKLFEWVRVLRKSFKHNKYLWLSQILTQLKDHLPTGVSPRCWRKVHHQCVLLFRPLCSVYIRFSSWDGNANYIPSLLCSQVLSFTFLVVERRDKAGEKRRPWERV